MELIGFDSLLAAAGVALHPAVLVWILAGVVIGLIFGASPGLTATTGVALALPLTFSASFEQGMALLLGIYCAGYFAGSIPAILINTPGAPGNAATAMGGYPLARAGKADLAISLAVCSSAVGGAFSIVVLFFAAPQLSSFALQFTAVEYTSLGLFGLVCVAAVSGPSVAKGIAAAVLGMFLGTVGMDEVGGTMRFTMGMSELQGGVPLIPALVAFFAVAEILVQSVRSQQSNVLPVQERQPFGDLVRLLWGNVSVLFRGSLIGTLIGILPGAGPTIASWIAYGHVSGGKRSEDASELSHARGVMAAEASNNAVTGGALVPLLTLGIPGETVTAVLIGAFLIHGIDPGPFFIIQHPDLFAQILVILFLSAVMFVALTLMARPILPRILDIPPRLLLPVVGVLCVSGGFAVSGSPFEVGLIAVLGVFGYVMLRFGFPMAPVVLGLVLGPIIEVNLRNGLKANSMDPTIFITRPISAILLTLLILTLAWRLWRSYSGKESE